MLREDAIPFWVRVESTAAQDTAGKPVCRTVMSDITESKRALDSLRGFVQKPFTLDELGPVVSKALNQRF